MSNTIQPSGANNFSAVQSPLSKGINPKSLDELMAQDVESMTDRDVDRIVALLRAQRAGWLENEAKAKPKAKAKSAAEQGTAKPSLADLGLE